MRNLVSIIVPCYNLERYILDCLKSIEKLNYRPLEIIIVDDGSTDNSTSLISDFIKKNTFDGQNYCLILQKNGGASSARNTGLQYATGEYVAFVDGDDTVDVDYITKMIDGIKQSHTDLCLSGVREFDENNVFKPDFCLKDDIIQGKDNILLEIDKQRFILCNLYCKIYKREIIKQYGLKLDTRLKVSEDLFFNLDYCKVINSVRIIDYCGYNYRVRNGSLIHNVTIPTKQKYVLSHFLEFFSVFSQEVIENSLKVNTKFVHLFWTHGILNYIQAQILEKKDYKSIYSDVTIKYVLQHYYPKNKKDCILFFCLTNKYDLLLKYLILMAQ